jgi:hypothetical protein
MTHPTAKFCGNFRTGSGVIGVPVSFVIDGKQYIAIQSGWGVEAAHLQARLNLVRPWDFPDVPQGGSDLGVCLGVKHVRVCQQPPARAVTG